jgi:hypothetical protein
MTSRCTFTKPDFAATSRAQLDLREEQDHAGQPAGGLMLEETAIASIFGVKPSSVVR